MALEGEPRRLEMLAATHQIPAGLESVRARHEVTKQFFVPCEIGAPFGAHCFVYFMAEGVGFEPTNPVRG
jgi:hypothetical protein